MNKVLRIVFYCTLCLLYGTLLLGVLLFFRFPEAKFKQHCISYVEQVVPGMSCSITKLSFALPLSIVFSEVKFIEKGSPQKPHLVIEELRISPKMSHLFEKYVIRATVNKGTIETVFSLDLASKQYVFDAVKIAGLQLDNIGALETRLKRKVTGNLAITGRYSGKLGESWFRGSGVGSAEITDGSLQFLFPVLSLEALDLQKMQTEWKLDKAVLVMGKGNFVGKELKGAFTGNVQFGSSFDTSRFDVKGELTPLPPLLKKSKQAQQMLRHLHQQKKGSNLPFRLDGMVITPALHLGSKVQ